ncbi:MAG: HTH-type transcriptional regulator/antitoxin HipB [Candidatus Omnitrophota bacterium]|jgi:HTH-type transcriptional regulator/antitoxin HipB
MNKQILNTKDLGGLIRHARKAQGISQDDLAGMSGVGRRFISELENGKETAEIGKVLLILGSLGIALNAVLKWHSLND